MIHPFGRATLRIMKKLLSTRPIANDFALLLLRLIPFGFLLKHGWGKFQDLVAGGSYEFYNFMGLGDGVSLALAVVGEFICPLLILLGLLTRPAAIPVIITMLVAAFGAHADSPLGKGEHALLFGAAALVLFFTGPGKYSVDKVIFK